MDNIKNMKDIIEQSFSQYAGAVLQSRAIVDVRDCLKPSARQIFYCLYTDKFLPSKPFKKTLKAIGSIARMYIHGDSSAEGVIMRASQEFAMRYPLVEVEGNNGNLISSGNWAASRYTSARLSEFNVKLFEDIDKETIKEWRDNYDDTEKYPSVLPSKGFYNIVNGTSGIAIGAASSIPQFNIKDVNKALEILLLNPNASFEEIYCPPDFATGAFLINEEEVKNTLKYGSKTIANNNGEMGAACKLRAKIDYDEKDNCLIVTEMPYGVYTNTICEQLEAIINDEEKNIGIDRFNDLTGINPNIKIYLKKNANINQVIKFLYKNTSLQYHYSINMTMLDNGRYPRVFTWKEALQKHIEHELEVYKNGYNFELNKLKNRIHIVNGLLICIASIEEVIKIIKSSSSSAAAAQSLQNKFLLDEIQCKAILDMKLSRLAHLEVEKLKSEKEELEKQILKIEEILNNQNLLNQELIKAWREVAKKYGDDHRTKIIKVVDDVDKEIEDIKPEDCVVILTKNNLIKRVPASNFKIQKRGGKGIKNKDDILLDSIFTNTIDNILVFTDKGKMYKLLVDNIPMSKGVNINTLISLEMNEKVEAITSLNRTDRKKYVIFITKKGLIKKTLLEEYIKTKRNNGIIAIKLEEEDSIANVSFVDDEEIILVTKNGMGIHFESKDIAAIGRVTKGVKAIKLDDEDEVLNGVIVKSKDDTLLTVTKNGIGKRIKMNDLPIQGRGGKGVIISKNEIAGTTICGNNDNIFVVGYHNSLCLNSSEIPVLGRTAAGNILIKDSVQSVTRI